MNIFYSQTTLNDNLVSLINDNDCLITKIDNDNILFFNQNNELIGFNIANISKDIPLKPGRIYLTDEIIKYIESKIKNKLIKNNAGFVVGKIIECTEIENTHLHKCIVDIGNEKLNIVCGAKNVRKDLLTVVAKVNTVMNSGLIIKPSKLQGYESNGMLCSQKELNIINFNDIGIIELDNNYCIGDVFKNVYSNL